MGAPSGCLTGPGDAGAIVRLRGLCTVPPEEMDYKWATDRWWGQEAPFPRREGSWGRKPATGAAQQLRPPPRAWNPPDTPHRHPPGRHTHPSRHTVNQRLLPTITPPTGAPSGLRCQAPCGHPPSREWLPLTGKALQEADRVTALCPAQPSCVPLLPTHQCRREACGPGVHPAALGVEQLEEPSRLFSNGALPPSPGDSMPLGLYQS